MSDPLGWRLLGWRVQASITQTMADGYTSTRQLPHFMIETGISGALTGDGAKAVAMDVVGGFGDHEVDMLVHPVYDKGSR